MKLRSILLTSLAVLLSSTACTSGVRKALGSERATPDEFRVMTIAPLTIPPEYNLRPPKPGELRAEDVFTDRQASRAIYGSLDSSNATDAEILFAARAGSADANPDVRALIDGETAAVIRKDKELTDRILFWRDGELVVENTSEPIDPDSETSRIKKVTGEGEVDIIRRPATRRKLPGL